MSGIAGIFYIDGRSVERAELEPMVSILAHRGPDAHGAWNDGPVALGHRMLQTTPESVNERMPLADAAGNLILTADLRLDNRDELLATLGLIGPSRQQITDGALVLAAYQRWGTRCPEHLVGDFAFAIYDRSTHSLFCTRDRFGVKPFYYYSSPKGFAFASEIKALLELPETPRRLNEVRVADYLASVFDDTASTFYQDIYRLPPAHSMTVSPEGTKLRCYWSLDPSREIQLASVEDYAEAFKELFTQAVNRRLRSSYRVGSLLSGGLDSSAITCVARNLLAANNDGQLSTFSAIFDEVAECDERFFINAVLSQNGVEPHYIHGDQLGPLTDLERVLWHQDEPLFCFNHFLNWSLYTTAARRGVRVILDGFDGDTTVSHGTGYLPELAMAGQWLTLAREVRGLGKNFGISPWKMMGDYIWQFGLKRRVWNRRPVRAARRIWGLRGGRRRTTEPSPFDKLFNPEFAQRIGLVERLRDFQEPPPRSERMHHHTNLNWGVMPYTLEVLDRAAAAFSIEPRYPFWDQQLVEFCLALPPEQKIHRGWTRMVLRQALSGILPAEVQWRGGKSNLGPNFQHTLLAFERERLDDVIVKDPGPMEDYVDTTALRQAYARFGTQPTDDDTIMVWKGANLALWLRQSGLRP
ncbi:MAG: lasso peptide isopeptide bond-forming cyclase [Chloroflexi bacterium]|nr:lasso peptide isopeptide bond-forming cyclase [Chloroflexota bacterium]